MAVISATIKRFCTQRSWTQRELVKKAKLAEVSVARLGGGMRDDPPLSTLKKLAKAFGGPITDLLD